MAPAFKPKPILLTKKQPHNNATRPKKGGGCGVGVGLGWGWGGAWGSKYVVVDPEFAGSGGGAGPGKPQWLQQLQQQLRIAKFEHSHHHGDHR